MSRPNPAPASADWSNAFWGLNDEGYEVVQARLRSSAKTVDALQSFWHERIAIEEDYARRLSKLGKSQGALIGKDEEGHLREALETLGRETDGLGESHRNLAGEMKVTLEAPGADFAARLATFKKTNQTALEKIYKLKLSQEGYVNKARDKLSQQMLLSNSYTAQSSLSQGRELDRVASKLDRAQGNVASAERDLRNFLGALGETWGRWVEGWKAFCDEAQDLEEERIDFIKDVCWAYANSVSSVCVVDDEACERMRVSLETVESFVESEHFVRAHSTSSKIPDPPKFVNYSAGERDPEEVAFKEARFVRRSARPAPVPASPAAQQPPVVSNVEQDLAPRQVEPAQPIGEVERAMEELALSHAALGSQIPPVQNGRSFQAPGPAAAVAPPPSPPVFQQPPPPPPAAPAPAPIPAPVPAPPAQQGPPPQLPQSIMSPPPHSSQTAAPPSAWSQPAASPAPPSASTQPAEDPIAKALADLQAKRMSRQGSFRSTASRNSQAMMASPRESVTSPAMYQGQGAFGLASPSLVPPGGGSNGPDGRNGRNDGRRRSVDYSQAGESIVGHHPSSRPNSPAPSSARAPSPALMQAPIQPPSSMPVEKVLETYHQSFPGETRETTRARRNSAASEASNRNSMMAPPNSGGSQAGHGDRSPSREGFAGVGTSIARASSPSPSFNQGIFPNRAPSPSPSLAQQGYGNYQQPGRAPSPSPSFAQQQGYQQQLHQPPARGASPAPSQMSRRSVGIALGTDGTVNKDEMAESYRPPSVAPGASSSSHAGRPPSQAASPHPSAAASTPPLHQQQHAQQAVGPQQVTSPQSMYSPYGPATGGAQQQQPGYAYPPYGYAPPPPQQPAYGMAPQPQGAMYGQQQYGYGAAPPPSATVPPPQHMGVYGQQPPAIGQGSSQQGHGHAGRSGSVVSHQGGYQQQPPPPQQQQQQPAPIQTQQLPTPTQSQPSPGTPGAYDQVTDGGQPVIFYVKALYDYTATIPEEFDFQSGDIIAVTATPDDGWWSGELLDETRRRPGQNTFPSNFVTMF